MEWMHNTKRQIHTLTAQCQKHRAIKAEFVRFGRMTMRQKAFKVPMASSSSKRTFAAVEFSYIEPPSQLTSFIFNGWAAAADSFQFTSAKFHVLWMYYRKCESSTLSFVLKFTSTHVTAHIYKTYGGITQWLGRRPLAGGLLLICARSMVDRWPLCSIGKLSAFA